MRVLETSAQIRKSIVRVIVDNGPSDSLLENLPSPVRAIIETHGRERRVTPGRIICNAVVFPRTALIAICVPLKDGHCPEVGTIGREGIVGPQSQPLMAVVHTPGTIITVPLELFSFLIENNKQIAAMDAACKNWLTLQAQILVACNSQHGPRLRFCRWLLRASNAIGNDTVQMTEEAIGVALGTTRTQISSIVTDLKMNNIISHRRGQIRIRDRAALVSWACDCHRALEQHNWPSKILKWEKVP